MKKNLYAILIIFLSLIFITNVSSKEDSLYYIIGVDRQFSKANSNLIYKKINELGEKLNMTEEQKEKASDIGKNSAKKLNIYKVNFIEEKKKLIVLKRTGANLQAVQSQIKLIRSLKSRINITRKKNMNEFEAILTPDQQKVFNEFKIELSKIKETEKSFDREPYRVIPREDVLKSIDDLSLPD